MGETEADGAGAAEVKKRGRRRKLKMAAFISGHPLLPRMNAERQIPNSVPKGLRALDTPVLGGDPVDPL